jgi:hypothetical protein
MSTNPDALVTTLSRWLARHVDDAQLKSELGAADTDAFSPEQAEAVEELREELARANGRGELEMVVRETLEALALG